MILSYTQLQEIVEQGVMTNVAPDQINAASIDITVGSVFFIEENPKEVVSRHAPPFRARIGDTAEERVAPMMRRVELQKGESLVLQPGQVALAQSQQVFNLPKNLSCKYLEKSSMGRTFLGHMMAGWCFVGETLVRMLDGTTKQIKDVKVGDWVYSSLPSGDFAAGKVIRSGKTATVTELVTVRLDSGAEFTCTADHMIMDRSGRYVRAIALQPGTALMPFDTKKDAAGYEMVYCPHLSKKSNWKGLHGKWKYTHRLLCGESGKVAHHRNGIRTDNRPENLELMNPEDHARDHRTEYARSAVGRATSSRTARSRNLRLWESSEFRQAHARRSSTRMSELNSDIWADPKHRARMADLSRQRYAATIGSVDPAKVQRAAKLGGVKRAIQKILEIGDSVSPETYTREKRQNAPTIETLEKTFGSFEAAVAEAGYTNHKVVSVVKSIAPPTDVYDLTVEGEHNFALDCGVVVHNCDAGWNGSVLTLELKNETQYHEIEIPVGVRIGQMIFFPHDEVPDEASYATRGRYNGDTETKGVKP